MRLFSSIASALLVASTTHALDIDVSSSDSISNAAKAVAKGLMANYTGDQKGQIPGIFTSKPPAQKGSSGEYFWWSFGAIFDAMVDYQYYTGDGQYNNAVQQALLWQVGPSDDYLPPNQTTSEGNDDQTTWGFAAMTAAERNFSAPPSGSPSWLKIAQNVFDDQAGRWDKETCKGGLRWQIFTFNSGYNYKNTIANGQFLQLAARLYAQTGNQTYATWAEEVYTWAQSVGLVNEDGSVYDGAQTEDDCSQINRIQFSMNSGVWLYGSAVMANATKGSRSWTLRAQSILNHASSIYLNDSIIVETACENTDACTQDQHFYKGAFARDLARTVEAMPSTADTIKPILQTNAKAAAQVGCKNADNCVFVWTAAKNDEGSDLGSQFSALQVIQSNLVSQAKATANTSSSDSGSGSDSGSSNTSSSASGTASGTTGGTAAPTGAASLVLRLGS
ncbi:mannan endo-1,6-alpha-mannosidase [Rhizodiscina lignyota]|uniref:Mannan endo-1,6-alpha-mannosidase n=1 Tax=Rhizodiscina lignyota TaxID=1504668 RepID=A0A9P4IMJ2_9PEZI|nr:mannan endo-1,6-alpha-mannosidase [Rhizodiscina lignyota]